MICPSDKGCTVDMQISGTGFYDSHTPLTLALGVWWRQGSQVSYHNTIPSHMC